MPFILSFVAGAVISRVVEGFLFRRGSTLGISLAIGALAGAGVALVVLRQAKK